MAIPRRAITLDVALARFIADRRAHCSARTIEWYQFMLQPLGRHFHNTRVSHITAEDLRAYMIAQRTRVRRDGVPLSGHTLNGQRRAARIFFRWAQEEGLIRRNPATKLKSQRVQHTRLALTFEQVEVILEALRRGRWKMVDRDFALFLFLYDTAARREEVCRLRIEEINLELGFAYILGKGDKSRRVGLLPLTVSVLRGYLAGRYHGPVFLTEHGQALQADGVREIFRRLSERVKIHLYPHLLRHTSATHARLNGIDIEDLQVILGHSQIATTLQYIEAAREIRALEEHREHSPLTGFEMEEGTEPMRARLRRVK